MIGKRELLESYAAADAMIRRRNSLPNVEVHTPLPATASYETEVKP
jgi:hypothetical protein